MKLEETILRTLSDYTNRATQAYEKALAERDEAKAKYETAHRARLNATPDDWDDSNREEAEAEGVLKYREEWLQYEEGRKTAAEALRSYICADIELFTALIKGREEHFAEAKTA